MFTVLRRVLGAAPLAAFGALAFTVGTHGVGAIGPLVKLVAALYAASLFFVLVVLGALARASGVGIVRLLACIKEALLLAFATASSSVAMPQLIEKMVRAGCPRAIAGLVILLDASFNLNGSNIYLTLALGFLAQACAIELSLGQVTILAVAMITSKGASGVAGSAYMALAATLVAVPQIPDASLVVLVGIERLLKCRADQPDRHQRGLPRHQRLGGAAGAADAAWRPGRHARRAAALISRPAPRCGCRRAAGVGGRRRCSPIRAPGSRWWPAPAPAGSVRARRCAAR